MTKNIVMCGTPLAGKFTILDAIAKHHERELRSVKLPSSKVPSELPEHTALTFSVQESGNRFDVTTVSGGTFGDYVWKSLMDKSSGIILVSDPTPELRQNTLDFIASLNLHKKGKCPGSIILSKCDIFESRVIDKMKAQLRLSMPNVPWPIFLSRIGDADAEVRGFRHVAHLLLQ